MAAPERTLKVEEIWGTAIGLDVRDRLPAGVLDDVFTWFHRVDDLFSTWRDDTEISRLARGDLRLEDASIEVRDVLKLCAAVKTDSRGAFDIAFAADARVEPRPGFAGLDPSGLVKGWALERAAEIVTAGGGRNFTINAGGDVLTRGQPAPRAKWRVGIQHPWSRAAVAAVVEGCDLAVATSGRYERGEHIISPMTGTHPSGLMSVTVIGDDLALADAYATAAIVLGRDGMEWIATIPGVEALGISDQQEVITTTGFDRFRVA